MCGWFVSLWWEHGRWYIFLFVGVSLSIESRPCVHSDVLQACAVSRTRPGYWLIRGGQVCTLSGPIFVYEIH